jgi:hypothetical protein
MTRAGPGGRLFFFHISFTRLTCGDAKEQRPVKAFLEHFAALLAAVTIAVLSHEGTQRLDRT